MYRCQKAKDAFREYFEKGNSLNLNFFLFVKGFLYKLLLKTQ